MRYALRPLCSNLVPSQINLPHGSIRFQHTRQITRSRFRDEIVGEPDFRDGRVGLKGVGYLEEEFVCDFFVGELKGCEGRVVAGDLGEDGAEFRVAEEHHGCEPTIGERT